MTDKVSIIIPVKQVNDYIKESLPYIENLDYDRNLIEVIILPDSESTVEGDYSFELKVIPTGHIHPGEKRDIGIKNSTGSIVAFIDDDVYPAQGWLKNAVSIFKEDAGVGAVGGPAATPPADSFLQKVSGFIYSSFLGGGSYSYRYIPKKRRQVDDYPSCNLIIRRDVLDKIGGFNTDFWPGEDTVICLKITGNLKMKIIYDPGVFVYHHRRKFFRGHMKQVVNYAKHRGYFVKRFPETSLRPSYFIPTFFTIYILSFVYPLFFSSNLLLCWSLPLCLYVFLLIADGFRTKSVKFAFPVMFGILVTHIFYGIFFIIGLSAKKLKEEK